MTKLEWFERCARNSMRISIHKDQYFGIWPSARLGTWANGEPSAILHMKIVASWQSEDKWYFAPVCKE